MAPKAFVFSLCMAIVATAAWASGSSDQAYLKARNQAVAKLESLYRAKEGNQSRDMADQQAQHELASLQTMLRALVGPIGLKGFPTQGNIHLDTLSKGDIGFGNRVDPTCKGRADQNLQNRLRAQTGHRGHLRAVLCATASRAR